MSSAGLLRAAVALVGAALAVAGCGNAMTTEIVGATGVTVDQQGDPQAVVVVCHASIDRLTLTGDRTGLAADERNPLLGTWTAHDALTRGVHRMPLLAPSGEWSFAGSFRSFEPERRYILVASNSERDLSTSQVVFHSNDLEVLDSATVMLGTGSWPADTLVSRVCEPPE